ncbi:MAG: prolyl oligopeptidase family serine peptidase [Fuerstiella sp.]
MSVKKLLYAALACCLSSGLLLADGEGDNNPENVRRIPRQGVDVPADREATLRQQLSRLQSLIAELRKQNDAETTVLLPDVMIFERAVRCALDHDEFFSPKDVDKADFLLQEGISRAQQLMAGEAAWPHESGLVVRGYVSRIDHTVQPYGLVVPSTYAFNQSVPTRCDIWFHGRGETLSEVNFIWDRMKNAGRYTPDHTIVLHPYGRYSNAFRFAGETDVLEALEDVKQRYRIDEDRISVRGFSMGGAACWQFAVHYPDRWFAANPGAGFSETPEFLKFFQKETLNPMPWEKDLWNLYDCNKYALNLTHCPTIAYSGENDSQKQAADVMETALLEHGIRLRHVIGAGMGHTIDAASRKIIEAGMTSLAKRGRIAVPRRLQFETYTLKYNRMHWLTVDALEQHWRPARVTAAIYGPFAHGSAGPPDGYESSQGTVAAGGQTMSLDVRNIRELTIDFASGTCPISASRANVMVTDGESSRTITVDGPASDGSWHFSLSRNDEGVWRYRRKHEPSSGKRHNLQGPIDDAFMDSFVFVRPTGTAASEAAGRWVAAELDRAIEHWRRHFRGDARVVDDRDVTDELIQSTNLVLWGDPSSNSVMARVADQLPIRWNSSQITVGDRVFDAAQHVPILIYPNPLNPERYVVFNSSFTFRDYAYLNNARQVPMLPDWAIVDLTTAPGNVWPGRVVAADFFDEQWQLKP